MSVYFIYCLGGLGNNGRTRLHNACPGLVLRWNIPFLNNEGVNSIYFLIIFIFIFYLYFYLLYFHYEPQKSASLHNLISSFLEKN